MRKGELIVVNTQSVNIPFKVGSNKLLRQAGDIPPGQNHVVVHWNGPISLHVFKLSGHNAVPICMPRL